MNNVELDDNTRASFEQMGKQVQKIGEQVALVYSALVGNELTKDGGLVETVKVLRADVDPLLEFRERFTWTLVILGSSCGAIGGLLTLFISYIKK